ncbi:MAG: endolytic transglycosylase MltG, partial [Candidatus Aminicenantales bacterium]
GSNGSASASIPMSFDPHGSVQATLVIRATSANGLDVRRIPVTVAEGLTSLETFPLFVAAGFGTEEEFHKASTDTSALGILDPLAADLEGYLYPETYRLPKGIPAAGILSKMVDQFRGVFAEPWRRRAAALGFSVRDAVILASLIEKETGRPEEKPLVSSVFHNRLRADMRLECDPTIIYALKKAGTYDGKLHGKDLRFESPYNTYLHAGLPPGPICNPGRASLAAALHPADTEFLYFVARHDGSHQFSRTLREHNRAVDEYRR